jgi:hypothetical protein
MRQMETEKPTVRGEGEIGIKERENIHNRQREWTREAKRGLKVWGSIHYNGAMCLATNGRLLVRSLPGNVYIRLFRLSAHADNLRLDVSDVTSAGNAQERSQWRWEPNQTNSTQTERRLDHERTLRSESGKTKWIFYEDYEE